MPAETEIERLVVKFLGDNEQYKKVLKENVKASDQWAVDTTRSLNKVRGEIQTLRAIMADRNKPAETGFFKKLVTGFDSEKLNITQQRKLIQEQKALYGSVTKSIVGVDLNKVNQTLDRIERLQQRNFLGNSAGTLGASQREASQLGMASMDKQMEDFGDNLEGQRSAEETKNGVSNETLAREKYIKDTYRMTLIEKEAYRAKQEQIANVMRSNEAYVGLAKSIQNTTDSIELENKALKAEGVFETELARLRAEEAAKDLGLNDDMVKRIGLQAKDNQLKQEALNIEKASQAARKSAERAEAGNPGLPQGYAASLELSKQLRQHGMKSIDKEMEDYEKSLIGVDVATKKLMISTHRKELEQRNANIKADAQTATIKEMNSALYDRISTLKLEAAGVKHVKEEVILRYAAEKGADKDAIAKARARIKEIERLEKAAMWKAHDANPVNQARVSAYRAAQELPRMGSQARQEMTAQEYRNAQVQKKLAFDADRAARAAAFDNSRRIGGGQATDEFRAQQGQGRRKQNEHTQALLAEARNRAAARKSNRPGSPDLYMDQLSFFINSLGGSKGHPELGSSGMAVDDIIFGDQLGVERQKFGERKGRKQNREQREMSSGVVAAMEARRKLENRKRQTGGNPDLLLGGMDFLNGGGDANKNKQQAQQRENESTKRRDEQASNKQIGLLERVAKASEEQVKSILLKKILTSGIKA